MKRDFALSVHSATKPEKKSQKNSPQTEKSEVFACAIDGIARDRRVERQVEDQIPGASASPGVKQWIALGLIQG